MTNLIALSLTLKNHSKRELRGGVNEIQTRALLAGLNVFYDEVLVWTTHKNLAVWVSGTNQEFLYQAFRHLPDSYQYHIMKGNQAIEFFTDIIKGTEWKQIGCVEKYDQLSRARQLAADMCCVHEALEPLIERGLHSLKHQPLLFGLKNGWSVAGASLEADASRIGTFPQAFYRFSLN